MNGNSSTILLSPLFYISCNKIYMVQVKIGCYYNKLMKMEFKAFILMKPHKLLHLLLSMAQTLDFIRNLMEEFPGSPMICFLSIKLEQGTLINPSPARCTNLLEMEGM